LTEADREKAGEKLKEIDSIIGFKIISTYRYLIKASRDGVKEFDLGIPTVGERLTISRRVKDYFEDQEVLLDKISPKVLFEKTFSEEDERKSVAELWEAFLKFPELPMLEGEHVLKNSIVQGVQTGTFGLLIDDKVWYLQTISPEDISEEAFVVRKEIAQKMKEEAGVPTGIEVKPPTEIPSTKIVPEKGVIRKVALRATVPWDRLSDLIRGVFTPLSREGAQISLEVKIEAESKQGISKDTLDLKIKETLNQIGAKVLEEKEE
ncbi:MAG: hypothetical protein QXY96_06435, partial [Candidatus Methanomethylicaceae archaeon]